MHRQTGLDVEALRSRNEKALPSSRGLSREGQLAVGVACGVAIGSAYYAQPILLHIGRALSIDDVQLGLVPMASQIGLWLGVLLLLPLGDLMGGRRLAVIMLVVNASLLCLLASVRTAPVLISVSALVGLTAITQYLLPPLVSRLVSPSERGRVMGYIASGVFAGILVARAVSGVVAEHWGWQLPFLVGAGLCLLTALMLHRVLPPLEPLQTSTYREVLVSLRSVVGHDAVVRHAALLQGLQFATFTVFWVSLPFHLAGPAFGRGSDAVAWIAIVGLVGIMAAPSLGKIIDRKGSFFGGVLGTGLSLLAWIGLLVGPENYLTLAGAVILLDLGVTTSHIANQTRIFSTGQHARSRINTIYMLGLLGGGAIAAPLTTWSWGNYAWCGVIAIGTATAAGALLMSFAARDKRTPAVLPETQL